MTDEKIMELLSNHDENALSAMDAKYGDYFRSIAYHILQSYEDAEECVNSAYLKAWDNASSEKSQNLKGYIGTIVRNISLNHLRTERAERRGSGVSEVLLSELADSIPSGNNVEEALESAFLAEMIIKWLEKEKTENRRLFIGRYWYGYTLGELAESQNVSQNKVTVTLHRMRKRLRRFLEREGISV